ncbi:MAG: hypothetical protein QOJ19_4950, partial [Acidimicrobiia bacterium]|nr:hypothetical protein [Acidimicrobiia bacterium]
MRGLNVLEIGASPAAAYCARLFATAGSDVVVLEPLTGAPLRWAPPWLPAGRTAAAHTGRSATHEFLNAYKRSVALVADDPRTDDLLTWADLVISSTNGTPDDAFRLHQRIRAANPAAVHVV